MDKDLQLILTDVFPFANLAGFLYSVKLFHLRFGKFADFEEFPKLFNLRKS